MSGWFIVLYEWQGAQNLTDCRTWWPSAEILSTESSAQDVIERHRKSLEPRDGHITYRNVRGPFPWTDPA